MPDLSLVARDRGLLWHPYAPLRGADVYAVTGARDVRLQLEAGDGTRFEAIDAMSSWWCAVHGYANPVLDQAVADQVREFSHVMFGGLTHEPAVRLGEQLVRLSPPPLQHVFFADSGSVSVEIALKAAVQYQAAVGRPGRRRFLALRGGYHGDTAGAMSVCDPVDGLHAAFSPDVVSQHFAPRPPAARLHQGELVHDAEALALWLATVEEMVLVHEDGLAAIIVEPVLQGAGGMHIYPPACLQSLRHLADEHGLLLIFDEIATGFGRTGRLFAADWAGVVPDLMCVGKALTGGYMTLAAVLFTAEVGAALSASAVAAIQHGPTFMANPLACAVAGASLELLETSGWEQKVDGISMGLARSLAPAAELDCVHDVRTLGAVGVVQLTSPVDVAAVTRAALDLGVWIRPFRDLVYTMPPYTTEPDDVEAIGSAITAAVERVHG